MIKKTALLLLLSGCLAQSAQARQDDEAKEMPQPAVPEADAGANVVRIAPLTAMDIGYGFGLSYERLLGSEQRVGLIFPVSLLLEKRPVPSDAGKTTNTYFYFTPGVKIYPFGQRRITYAVGPSLMFGYGENADRFGYYFQNNGTTVQEDVLLRKFRLGFIVNNYLSFRVTRALQIGFEGGIGMRYLDRETFNSPGAYLGSERVQFRNGFNITGQFSMTLGLKF